MKAIVKTQQGPGHVRYQDMPEPGRPGPGMLLVQVYTAGICGTDIHVYHDTFPNRPPVIMGHEYVGLVLEVGEGVRGFSPGDKVSSEVPTATCGTCLYCRTGDVQHCVNRTGMGCTRPGAFAKYVMVEEAVTHLLPDNVDLRLGALVEPVATCSHCMELTGIQGHETVVIAGPGPIGLVMLQLAKAEGARVIVTGTDLDEARLRLAGELGADELVNVQRQDGAEVIRSLTGGYGADVYIECSGNPRSMELGVEALRFMGRYTQMGVMGQPVTCNIDRLAMKEIAFTGVRCEKWTSWDRAVKVLQRGRVNLDKLATHEFGFNQWKEAFEVFQSKQALKILLHPVE